MQKLRNGLVNLPCCMDLRSLKINEPNVWKLTDWSSARSQEDSRFRLVPSLMKLGQRVLFLGSSMRSNTLWLVLNQSALVLMLCSRSECLPLCSTSEYVHLLLPWWQPTLLERHYCHLLGWNYDWWRAPNKRLPRKLPPELRFICEKSSPCQYLSWINHSNFGSFTC